MPKIRTSVCISNHWKIKYYVGTWWLGIRIENFFFISSSDNFFVFVWIFSSYRKKKSRAFIKYNHEKVRDMARKRNCKEKFISKCKPELEFTYVLACMLPVYRDILTHVFIILMKEVYIVHIFAEGRRMYIFFFLLFY